MKKERVIIGILLSVSSSLLMASEQARLGYKHVQVIEQNGLQFKDLNKDGLLTPYEDWRLSNRERAENLVGLMTLEERVGLMMHGSAPAPGNIIGFGSEYDFSLLNTMINDEKVTTFITRLVAEPAKLASLNNQLQELAEKSRLGIPATISIDPRSTYSYSINKPVMVDGFSKWPGTLGIAAIGDEKIARQYADIGRQEYRLLGVHQALSPMADLATEPRWSRIDGTFGEDPRLVKRMVRGYIEGMQNGRNGLNAESVSAVVKHWVGYGAAEDGFDSHNHYGKFAKFQGNMLQEHIYPFTGAFEARVSGVMPTYSIVLDVKNNGDPIEQVGAGFNNYFLQDLLRKQYKFDGVIISDWMITEDCNEKCINGHPDGETPDPSSIGMPWGVESLSKTERFAKATNAGIDQFGGVTDIKPLLEAIRLGLISEERINASVVKLLELKIALGLFEDPYVDPALAGKLLPNPKWQQLADNAQKDALVLLKKNEGILPLKKGTKVFLHGISFEEATKAGLTVVDKPEQADVAVIRLVAPYEQPHKNYFFGAMYHEGSLEFMGTNEDYQVFKKVVDKLPTIVTVYLDRPAILSSIEPKASVLIANFGINDKGFLSVLTNPFEFKGKLPFELPLSMDKVVAQRADKPSDSDTPLYKIGFGLK